MIMILIKAVKGDTQVRTQPPRENEALPMPNQVIQMQLANFWYAQKWIPNTFEPKMVCNDDITHRSYGIAACLVAHSGTAALASKARDLAGKLARDHDRLQERKSEQKYTPKSFLAANSFLLLVTLWLPFRGYLACFSSSFQALASGAGDHSSRNDRHHISLEAISSCVILLRWDLCGTKGGLMIRET
jgi:hypothetical protein